ncbi:hypothetical protein T06_972 [Trichinella sp. T6]|nr:hypothetical protein T06_972 [Trichinella sp. T6]
MISRTMPLSNIVRVSHHHITYVGYGDFNTKGKSTSDELSTAAVLILFTNQKYPFIRLYILEISVNNV